MPALRRLHWVRRVFVVFTVALAFLWWDTESVAQRPMVIPPARVTRGAYLQSGTSNSVVIRWRTSRPTESVVRYGTGQGQLDHRAGTTRRVREHVVPLTDLSPNTRYYYALVTNAKILQGGAANYFDTSPTAESNRALEVWALGDPGTGYPVQKAVRDAYLRHAGEERPNIVLTLGDNAYRRGTDWQYQKSFFDIYREVFKHAVVWPALGNHDSRSARSATESGVYFNSFTLPRQGESGGAPSGTEAYYSFDHGNTHFICLDSEDSDLSPAGPMATWLRRDLQASKHSWTIAFWHHPPYSKGSHDSDIGKDNDQRMIAMRENMLPILEGAGVDLVLCGHSHLYERSYPVRGHYGPSTTFRREMLAETGHDRYVFREGQPHGTIYINAGSAGHATKPSKLRGLNHPVMAVSQNLPGSLILRIKGAQMEVEFLDDRGTVRDAFKVLETP